MRTHGIYWMWTGFSQVVPMFWRGTGLALSYPDGEK